jgi:uncharacterized protein YutE (UPF0331/DUF86 family)
VTFLVERLVDLRRHLEHLRALRPRVRGPESLEHDLSLHNDVLFSLLTVCQQVIHIAGERAARRGDRYEDYTQARTLGRDPRFPAEVVQELERLPGFRNVVIHEYVALDMRRVVEALARLEPVERVPGRGGRPGPGPALMRDRGWPGPPGSGLSRRESLTPGGAR